MTTRPLHAGDASLTSSIVSEVSKRVVGQEGMLERLLVGLLTGGHIRGGGRPRLADDHAPGSAPDG